MEDGTMKEPEAASAAGEQVEVDGPRNARRNGHGALGRGLTVARRHTEPGVSPFDGVEWERRTAVITGEKGEVVFEQRDVEVPRSWSQLATNVVVSKYFRGPQGSPQRETSVRQLISRVADTIARWGKEQGYFATDEDAEAFHAELVYALLHQKASFNSPVWFNVGIEAAGKPQGSACFINSVEDNMESILRLAAIEARLFKGGSGTGTNLSTIRSSKEPLSGGGTASGPVSFMRGYDAFAGVIKSGGKTRRAAKMVILNVDHPDIVEFIKCKAEEEKKAWALIDAGYDGSFNGEAYSSVFFQNSNNSVRVPDAFMSAVEMDGEWRLRAVTTGEVVDRMKAKELMRMIAEAAWVCGDPGMQFDTTINAWHTCPNSGPIRASNPCSEFMFLDDSACNLASLNLLKFHAPSGEFDADDFVHTVELMITAQEILVDSCSYPTEAIERNSHAFRPLGLGYANLGALLMARGLPYDSEEGRAYAAAVTALMTGAAYRQSARMAEAKGAFEGFAVNREPMLRVVAKHRHSLERIDPALVPGDLLRRAREAWDDALEMGEKHGYRNAQVTVLAPTGTIGFMMDCDTTGIEPDIALVKYKKLVGGGVIKIVNQTIPEALARLGYDAAAISKIVEYVDAHDTIEGAPGLKEEHLPVFDCAFRPVGGSRSIHYMGHLRMMAAVQPFLSGAISKTVNMPNDATPEQIMDVYMTAWRLGLKSVAIYRDGCKRTQPLSTALDEKKGGQQAEPKPVRRRLPDERKSITRKFSVGGHEGYFTVGMYDDGTPGEIFIVMSKEGSVVSGLMDCFATAVSMALQYGVPLSVLVKKFSHTRFEPSGFTNDKEIPIAKSVIDYIFRWLALKFLPSEEQPEATQDTPVMSNHTKVSTEEWERKVFAMQADAPPCVECGAIMVRNGACYKCLNCGSTYGCS